MFLQPEGQRVDIFGMIDFELEELNRCEGWQSVLIAYKNAHEALKQQETESNPSDGWLSRLKSVDGVEFDDLPRIHGKLISLGLLKFQLADRTMGMRYQLSGLGKRAIIPHEIDAAHADSVDAEPSAETGAEAA